MNLTLWSDGFPALHAVSTLGHELVGGSYTWTPDESLIDGDYLVFVTQPDTNSSYSHLFKLDHNKTNDDVSSSAKISTSSTARITSTNVHSTSMAPVTATVTLPGTTAPANTSTPESPQLQIVPAIHQTISNGAIAGIVVGAVIFIILTTASAVLYRRRRRRSSQTAVSELPSNQTDADTKDPSATIWVPELGQEGAVYGPHELPVTPNPLDEPLGATEVCLAGGRVYGMAEPE